MMSQKENFFRFYLTEADPWYTGNFSATYADILEGCEGFLRTLKEEKKIF